MENKKVSVQLDEMMPLIRERLSMGQHVRFSPRGISMLPMLRPGTDSVVLCPLPEKLRKYDLPLYRRSNGHYVLHRIVHTGDTYTCVGDNQFELETGLEHRQMIGLVCAFTRGGREYTVEDLRYRLYCRCWHHTRPVRKLWRTGMYLIRRYLL